MFEDRSNSRRILHLIPAPVSKGVLGMPEISRRARILQEHAWSGVAILLRIFHVFNPLGFRILLLGTL